MTTPLAFTLTAFLTTLLFGLLARACEAADADGAEAFFGLGSGLALFATFGGLIWFIWSAVA